MAANDHANPPFTSRSDEPCEDEDVRRFLALGGWNINNPVSADRFAEISHDQRIQFDRRQRWRDRRPATILGVAGLVVGLFGSYLGPLIWKFFLAHAG